MPFFKSQLIPLVLTVVVCAVLIALYYGEILVLNTFTTTDIQTGVLWASVAIGLTIYVKTSIDFAIYIGNLMAENRSWKSRISIEIGTALGNALGTMLIAAIWTFFKEVSVLLFIMIFLASLVLFKMAEDGLEHARQGQRSAWFLSLVTGIEKVLHAFNATVDPVLSRIIPHMSMKGLGQLAFWPLMLASFRIPFILGLDDFAGYVPLFNVVNIYSFGIGVFVGHMLLNLLLYLSPSRTIAVVKNPIISFLGSLAFIGLGTWGIIEAVKVLGH